jgi:D-tagatose-1,6-bisphosphate aldolase subunit GatZ/KbaZ
MIHPLRYLLKRREHGNAVGITSFCTANSLALSAVMEQALRHDSEVLIEATANQVNQFGGYSGMRPADFSAFIYKLADKVGIESNRVILGGDHLGPLVWCSEPEAMAMDKAETLVREFVAAGFIKLHIDTSMRLGDDNPREKLSPLTVAQRGARLCKIAQDEFLSLQNTSPNSLQPVFVIGSEVPIPGGEAGEPESIQVTSPADFNETMECYHQAFSEIDNDQAWDNVVAVVVQPGVEFGDSFVHAYNRNEAHDLCATLSRHPGLVFEGHSTDYQSLDSLRKMVEDGVAILKVGPALTFALREILFALARMEEELLPKSVASSHFIEVLENTMLIKPDHWRKYYQGTTELIRMAMKYSLSDRARYYLREPAVSDAINRLLINLGEIALPIGLLHQYYPRAAGLVLEGKLVPTPASLINLAVADVVEIYRQACSPIGTV